MALDDFFRRQREEQEQKREAERILYEQIRKEREAREEFDKKVPEFFKDVIDPAIQAIIARFEKEHLDGIYARLGRGFRAARPSQRIDRDFHIDFQRNAVQFHIFPRTDSLTITVDVSTNPSYTELKSVNTSMDYDMEELNEEALLSMVGTALETLESLTKKEEGVLRLK